MGPGTQQALCTWQRVLVQLCCHLSFVPPGPSPALSRDSIRQILCGGHRAHGIVNPPGQKPSFDSQTRQTCADHSGYRRK